MATKTITITEDAYNLLKARKLETESFSEEITRLLTEKKKKSLMDFFGIISDETANEMHAFLKKKREINLKIKAEKWKNLQ